MAFTFLPDHPIHGQVSTHDQNMAKAAAIAKVVPQMHYQHGATHSVTDLSNARDGDKYMPGGSN